MNNDYGHFIDTDNDIDTHIDINTITENIYRYKKKNSDDNIIIIPRNNNDNPINKTIKNIIFCACCIITYHICYIIHHWNY